MYLIDADALEKDGWMMHRTIRVDKNTMEYQTKKPTKFPTVEPERKTGKWELIDDTEFRIPGYRCSVCHCECEDWENKPAYNYCPNCGAKMGEGEEYDR